MRVFFALLLVSSQVFAQEYKTKIAGFDGFEWGSSYEDIRKVYGDELFFFAENFPVSAMRDAKNERIAGLDIKSVVYVFDSGCAEGERYLGECLLQTGVYTLKDSRPLGYIMILTALIEKYGQQSNQKPGVVILGKEIDGTDCEDCKKLTLDNMSWITDRREVITLLVNFGDSKPELEISIAYQPYDFDPERLVKSKKPTYIEKDL